MDESEDIGLIRRILQLENQNLKLTKLLKAAVGLVSKDTVGVSKLQEKATSLNQTVNLLKKKKVAIKEQLDILDPLGSLKRDVRNLERDQLVLRAKLDQVLNQLSQGHKEIEQLKSEDEQLRKTLANSRN
nr:unnamed protein product [Callosobruchus chinensis]